MSSAVLHDFLDTHFSEFFADAKVTELSVNKPGELFVAEQGNHEMRRYHRENLSYTALIGFAKLVASFTNQNISEASPLLSADIPTMENPDLRYRIQFVRDPAVNPNTCAFSIRKPSTFNYDAIDAAYKTMFAHPPTQSITSRNNDELIRLYKQGRIHEFLILAVKSRKNIVISAGTDSGKTTLLNYLTRHIPIYERVISIEDARELMLIQQNWLPLFYSRGDQGLSKVTAQDLLTACKRLRPNRLILGELRGAEAYSFLDLITSGHPGAITTVHADTTEGALDKIVGFVEEAGIATNNKVITDRVRANVDVIIQLCRTEDGGYSYSEVYFKEAVRS